MRNAAVVTTITAGTRPSPVRCNRPTNGARTKVSIVARATGISTTRARYRAATTRIARMQEQTTTSVRLIRAEEVRATFGTSKDDKQPYQPDAPARDDFNLSSRPPSCKCRARPTVRQGG